MTSVIVGSIYRAYTHSKRAMFTPKRILVPMDFSDEAMLALDWALMLAGRQNGVTLYLAYVYPLRPDPMALSIGRIGRQTMLDEQVKTGMAAVQKRLPKNLAVIPLYATGSPAAEIVALCGKKAIDLVVMTTHGRKGIAHLLWGSVAEGIVRLAPCPVLVLHMNDMARQPVVVGDDLEHRDRPSHSHDRLPRTRGVWDMEDRGPTFSGH